MEDWLIYILTAAIIYGIMNFINKIAAELNFSSRIIVTLSALTISSITLIILTIRNELPQNLNLILKFAFMNGLAFGIANLSKIGALKKIPAAVVFPIDKLNAVFVIIIGFVFFKEHPNERQQIGILFSVSALFLFIFSSRNSSDKLKLNLSGFLLALSAALFTAFSMTVGKLASNSVDKLWYMFFSYSLVAVLSFSLLKSSLTFKEIKTELTNLKLLITGIIIGMLNGIGYYFVLKSFSAKDEMSVIQSIFVTSIFIPIILSRIFYKEKVSYMRLAAICLAIISVIFIKTS